MNKHHEVFFSVVIPAYNAARFIGEALRSVLTQTYPYFEVIVVNDGSEDDTLKVVEKFVEDRRLSVYTIPHRGTPAAARNHALWRAKGDYIAFLDADDLWMMDKLECFYNQIQRTRARFLFSNGFLIDVSGKRIDRILSPRMKQCIRAQDPLLLLTNIISCSSVVVRRDILPLVPFNEDEAIVASEDYCLWLKLNLENEIQYLPQELFLYRIHAGQTLSNYFVQLSRCERVLEQFSMIGQYEKELISLALELIAIRRLFTKRRRIKALARSAVLAWRVRGQERLSLLEYFRYGLSLRLRNRLLLRWRPRLTFR